MRYQQLIAAGRTAAIFCWAILPPVLLAGCGGPSVAPVSGRVTVAGQPVAKGSLIFMPNQDKGTSGKAATGDIQPDGTYTLSTFSEKDGAIVGHHRVVITGRSLEDDEGTPPNTEIPPRYGNVRQSGLTAEVKSAGNTIDFDLEP